jgi:hypothetical protein
MERCCRTVEERRAEYKRLFENPSHYGLMRVGSPLEPVPELCDECWPDVLSKRRVIARFLDSLEHPEGI